MPQHLVAVFAWNLGATAVVGIQAKLLRPKENADDIQDCWMEEQAEEAGEMRV